MSTLLDIRELSVDFTTRKGTLQAIRDVTLSIEAGETVCLVGESGSGKTVASKAIMRLIDHENGRISGGSLLLDWDGPGRPAGGRTAPDSRQTDGDGVPGADGGLRPGLYDRAANSGDHLAA
nr:ATP-binding cassette domain-containing protein [Paenibacillus cellulositrophicus]